MVLCRISLMDKFNLDFGRRRPFDTENVVKLFSCEVDPQRVGDWVKVAHLNFADLDSPYLPVYDGRYACFNVPSIFDDTFL